MYARKQYLENIIEKLSILKYQIELANCINLYDLNIYSESFFCDLLNLIYGYKLRNINFIEKNAQSIDLGDDESKIRISVQVTSDTSSIKIKETIEKFISNKYYEKYDRLIILILGNKKNYTTAFDTQEKFIFSKVNDIIDIQTLIQSIQSKSTSDIQVINDFLNRELLFKSVIEPTQNIHSVIENIKQNTRALCISKLKSTGISDKIASEIIEQDISSNKFEYVITAAKTGKNYLVGEFGSGKSHVILILVQRLIRKYLLGELKAIPLFAQAYEIIKTGSVQNWTEQYVKDVDYFIFIDGLDEIDYDMSDKIIEEIGFLKELWTNSCFVIGSRPILAINNNKESQINIQELTNAERCELVALMSNTDLEYVERVFSHLDKNIDKLLYKPFYCIIYALYNMNSYYRFTNEIDLITEFINKSIDKLKNKQRDICSQLEQIAILAVNYNLSPVHKSRLGVNININDILKTGFVILLDDEYFSFPLPIIAQWLAAEGIRSNKILIDDILCDENTISRWRYPLSILFSKISYEESFAIFSAIIDKIPGTASLIIKDGIRFGYADKLPTAYECGRKIRDCMQIWVSALEQLSQYIAPTGKNGLYNLAIYIDNDFLTTTWAEKENKKDIEILSFDEQAKWLSSTVSFGIPNQSTWPWIVTFENLSGNLKELVKNRSIIMEHGLMETEYVWSTSLELTGKGSLYEYDIEISLIEHYRQYIGKNYWLNARRKIHLDLYFRIVDKLLQKGIYVFKAPYPTSDKSHSSRGGYVWSGYSKDKMLEFVQFVYSNALTEYERLTNIYFPKIKNRMPMASLFPCRFIGYLDYDDDNSLGYNGSPSMMWYIEALPREKSNELIITLSKKNNIYDKSLLAALYKTNITYRPTNRDWLSATIHHGSISSCFSSTPVTNIIYKWLEEDFKAIGWINY